jgi:hypothetical protein
MITIGVTGHRFLAEVEKITPAIDRALDKVEEVFGNPPLRIISSLAKGSDMLVAQRALKRGTPSLVATLPLLKDEYLSDFPSPSSQEAFLSLLDQAEEVITLPAASTREEAYRAAGFYILDQADVLIAIWDGERAQGTGGTAEIVAEAHQRGLPIAWVHAGNRIPGTEQATTLGEEQGSITFEGFPCHQTRGTSSPDKESGDFTSPKQDL